MGGLILAWKRLLNLAAHKPGVNGARCKLCSTRAIVKARSRQLKLDAPLLKDFIARKHLMRYYFDLREGNELAIDEEGSSFSSVQAAQEEAAVSLASIARDAVKRISAGGQPMQVEVRDERGPVFQLKFAFDPERLRA